MQVRESTKGAPLLLLRCVQRYPHTHTAATKTKGEEEEILFLLLLPRRRHHCWKSNIRSHCCRGLLVVRFSPPLSLSLKDVTTTKEEGDISIRRSEDSMGQHGQISLYGPPMDGWSSRRVCSCSRMWCGSTAAHTQQSLLWHTHTERILPYSSNKCMHPVALRGGGDLGRGRDVKRLTPRVCTVRVAGGSLPPHTKCISS